MDPIRFIRAQICRTIENIQQQSRHILKTNSIEALHQLRVGLRRLSNCLKLYRGFFSLSQLKKWNETIAETARTASQARDLDVFLRFLNRYKAKLKHKSQEETIGKLVSVLKKKRAGLQPDILSALRNFEKRATLAQISKALMKLPAYQGKDDLSVLYKLGKERVFKKTKELLEFADIAKNPKKVKALHRMRIANKGLRYTLETLQNAYDKKITAFLKTILIFHARLGDIHDYHVWEVYSRKLFQKRKLKNEDQKSFQALQKHLCRLREDTYKEFIKEWTAARKAGFFNQLKQYVK